MWFGRKRDLEERVEKLERAQAALRLDWEETYDKLVKLVQRYTKRAEVIAASEQPVPAANVSPTGLTTVGSPRLDPISQRILDRRRKYFEPVQPEKEEATG